MRLDIETNRLRSGTGIEDSMKTARTNLIVVTARWAVVLLLAVPLPAVAQEKVDKVRALLDPATADRIEQIALEAAERGIPVDPIYDKALEGAAKRIPGPRIVPAVAAYAGRLGTAHDALGLGATPAWVIAGADALGRGVTPAALTRLNAESRNTRVDGTAEERRGPAAVIVLGDLVASGLPNERAIEVMEEALRSGQGEADIVAIPRAVNRLIRDGNSPRDAAQRLVRDMRQGLRVRRVTGRPPGHLLVDRPKPPVAPGVEPIRRPIRDGRPPGSRLEG